MYCFLFASSVFKCSITSPEHKKILPLPPTNLPSSITIRHFHLFHLWGMGVLFRFSYVVEWRKQRGISVGIAIPQVSPSFPFSLKSRKDAHKECPSPVSLRVARAKRGALCSVQHTTVADLHPIVCATFRTGTQSSGLSISLHAPRGQRPLPW